MSDLKSSDVPRREQDGDIVVDAHIEATAIQEFVETLRSVADEAKLNFDDHGIHARVRDPANVAATYPDLSTDAFESYDAGTVTIGVSLVRLENQLDMANKGQLIRLRVDMETRKLKLRVTDNIKPTIALIDPETIRGEPDVPDDLRDELPNTARLHPDDLSDALDAVDLVTDHVRFAWDASEEVFVVHGQGDVDETRVEYDVDDLLGGSDFGSETASLYSHGYMDELVGAIPKGVEEVEITFGKDFPVLIEYEAQDGALEVTAFCAPRIQSD